MPMRADVELFQQSYFGPVVLHSLQGTSDLLSSSPPAPMHASFPTQ